MAWCQNPYCGKKDLKKDDVEFCEDTHLVLCTGCYALRHPGWIPGNVVQPPPPSPAPPLDVKKVAFEAHFTTERGFTARLGYGEVSVGFYASMEEIKKLFKVPQPQTMQELNG
jgi:hypothetical protein